MTFKELKCAGWILLVGTLLLRGQEPGLIVTYRSMEGSGLTDGGRVDDAALYVPGGGAVTPFLPPGRFEARWRGAIEVDLRSDCSFQVDVRGTVSVSVNGHLVLEAEGSGESSPLSKPVRLGKGGNELEIVYTSPAEGASMLRLWWTDFESGLRPVGRESLRRPAEAPGLADWETLRLGRELFLDLRCARCHESPLTGALPDGAMVSSSFDDLGRRRQPDWVRRWVADPQSWRSRARMPRLLHGAGAKEEARLISVYLASLGGEADPWPVPGVEEGDAEAGGKLFEALHCGACHNGPGGGEDSRKIPLDRVFEKFTAGGLVRFLREPEEHSPWGEMPNFGLTEEEARRLWVYLGGGKAGRRGEGGPDSEVEAGRVLVETRGCLSCHELPGVENRFKAKPLFELGSRGGCLEAEGRPEGVPEFALTDRERGALAKLLETDRASLGRHVMSDFALRHAGQLGCANCHGQFEGFPSLAGIGGKLKPEWMREFLSGRVSSKPRPWLAARMPWFPARAESMAAGLAMLGGFGPVTPAEPPVEESEVAVGRRLVGKVDGFSCVSCHAVGGRPATDVFDSEGINLAHAGGRLQYLFFRRWLLDPLTIDPATKMPDFFDGMVSPLGEVHGGDAGKQVDAIWQYIRLGWEMPLPQLE